MTFKDEWNHVKICTTQCSWDPTSAPPIPKEIPGVVSRVETNWQVAKRFEKTEVLNQCQDAVWNVVRRMSCSAGVQEKPTSVTVTKSVPCALRRFWQSEDATHDQYMKYTQDFAIQKDFAAVPDDKNRKAGWKMPVASYILLCISFAFAATSWEHTVLREDEANNWLYCLLLNILGSWLAKRLRVSKASSLLPYVYVTVKNKCWTSAVRTCKKPLHSCVRKVVSYAAWPAKRTWRSIHRAWETILKHYGESNDTWSLGDASDRLKHGYAILCHNPTATCGRCGCCMQGCAGMVADAGQFFETVAPNIAIREAHDLLTIFCNHDATSSVTVRNSAKRISWLGGRPMCYTSKGITWQAGDLFRAFVAAMSVCLASVNRIVFRLLGLPIGGLLSKVAACITLGGQERRWKRDPGARSLAGFGVPIPWKYAVCHLRYIDDVILLSRIFCRQCLIDLLACIYSCHFDVATECEQLSWLDMTFDIFTGNVGLNVKPFCAPPPWGVPKKYLRNIFLGRFFRWWYIRPTDEEWRRACLRLLFDLKWASWSKKQVMSTLFSISHLDFLHMVRFCKVACGFVWPVDF